MSKILLDVNGWQSFFDFETGDNLEDTGRENEAFAKRLSDSHPYPGDTTTDSIKWVTDCGLDICKNYNPDFIFLSHANTTLMKVNTEMSEEKYHELNKFVLSEVERFLDETGYESIVISTGNMKKFENIVDTDIIEGYLSFSNHDPYMAGIFEPTEKDYESIKKMQGVTFRLKDDFCNDYPFMDEETKKHLPEIFLFSEKNYAFTQCGYRGMTMQVMPVKEKTCAAFSSMPDLPNDIFEFRSYIDKKLDEGKKIALIVVECVESEDMPKNYKLVSKYKNGIYYTEGTGFYYALCSSKEFYEPNMPYLFHNTNLVDRKDRRFPFSYIKSSNFQNPIGLRSDKKTAAVGTRSGITHSCVMGDYSIECHCRGLAESGVLVFINDEKL